MLHLALVLLCSTLPDFERWAETNGRTYTDEAERAFREATFRATVEYHQKRNAEEGPNGARYAVDEFSDWTQEELGALGCVSPAGAVSERLGRFATIELAAAAANPSIDWRSHGAVAAVQQQHPFGTCWAFSLIAMAEGVMVVQGGEPLAKLSEQMVVSCVPQNDTAQMADATAPWIEKATNGRLQLEVDYPYNRTCNFVREEVLAPDGTRDGYKGTCNTSHSIIGRCTPCEGIHRADGTPKCHLSATSKFSAARLRDIGYVSVGDPPDDTKMVAALAKYGPLQLAINTGCIHGYSGGIISNCTTTAPQGHAVTIVGAQTDSKSGTPFWIIKNSWGEGFGESGYFRVARSPPQLHITGAWFGCFNKGCSLTRRP